MPSFPAGHAITAGALVTILKAWFNEDLQLRDITTPDDEPAFPTVQPNGDGTALEGYDDDGAPLTIGGELNKLAHNVSRGRDMSGVHWRADDVEGNKQGENVAIRILREAAATYPEPFEGFTLTRFDGRRETV